MLTAAEIISVWELGSHRPDWSKALIALGAALPQSGPDELARMTIGERNARLLSLRRDLIGPVMHVTVKCPDCGEPLEFEQSIDELLDGYSPPCQREFDFASGEYAVRYRLLTSEDLADADVSASGEGFLGGVHSGKAIPYSDLPGEIGQALARERAERDPLAEIPIPLACAACEHVWRAALQIVPFLWLELERRAKHLLEDIVALARAYGWSEAQILAMGPERRRYYLDAMGQPG